MSFPFLLLLSHPFCGVRMDIVAFDRREILSDCILRDLLRSTTFKFYLKQAHTDSELVAAMSHDPALAERDISYRLFMPTRFTVSNYSTWWVGVHCALYTRR